MLQAVQSRPALKLKLATNVFQVSPQSRFFSSSAFSAFQSSHRWAVGHGASADFLPGEHTSMRSCIMMISFCPSIYLIHTACNRSHACVRNISLSLSLSLSVLPFLSILAIISLFFPLFFSLMRSASVYFIHNNTHTHTHTHTHIYIYINCSAYFIQKLRRVQRLWVVRILKGVHGW